MASWFKRLVPWLVRARLFAITIGVLLVCVAPVLLLNVRESQIRFIGLILQLFGISTVVLGISQTRRLFGRPSYLMIVAEWWRSRPKLHTPPITINVSEGIQVFTMGRAKVRQSALPNASLEDRVREVESKLQSIDLRMDDLQLLVDQASQVTRDGIAAERQSRERDTNDLRRKLELSETGGLDISLMGLIWLIVGLIMSTASQEISRLL